MNSSTDRRPLFERLKTGLEEAIRHAKGEITLKTTVLELPDPPPRIGAEKLTQLRLDHQMSQDDFARLLNVSTKSIQNWERGTRAPGGAALRLIQILRQSPEDVRRAAGLSAREDLAKTPRAEAESKKTPAKERPGEKQVV